MKKSIIFVLSIAFLACSGPAKQVAPPPTPAGDGDQGAATGPAAAAPVSDTEIGLTKTSVFDTPEPAAFTYIKATPGKNPVMARSFVGAPPVIPHKVDPYLPITYAENACEFCHKNNEQVMLPPSHYTDLRLSPDAPSKELPGARWRCMSCHLPQSDAPALVPTYFNPEP